MRRDLPSSAVNRSVGLGVYTKAMMISRILTICATAAACAAGTTLAFAQQGYPVPPGSVYSTAPGPYQQGVYVGDDRRAMPDFDALDDDEAPNAQHSTALPPPGPVMSPDDPRYGRPMGAPVYSDRNMPTGPVMSPDDPRYGRPAGPPPVIYSDRPPGQPSQAYPDSRVPGAGIVYPNDERAPRPPEGVVGAAPGVTGTVQPPIGADGKPMVLSALPPEEQPEVGAGAVAAEPAPPGSRLRHQGAGGNHRRRYAEHVSLLRAG